MTSVIFQEEVSARIPTLILLTNLDYTFIPPSQCKALRGNTLASEKQHASDYLLPIMRVFLTKQTFTFTGKQYT